ncbi:MAG: histidine phosphatase family protein [Rhizobacter sp.]|nr:histidine phosphatase family protein [Rhizobacter sp.]
MRQLTRCALVLALSLTGHVAAASEAAWSALKDGSVVLFRHANAPGGGDPPGFKLGDCSTQRNLDDSGRAQARRIGEQFRQRGIKVGAVLSSQWCRARETAELAFPGMARDDANFNSFFDDRSSEPAQTAQALATLRRWRGPGVLVVTTHQVNISALTGVTPVSGEGVVVAPTRDGVEVLGRLPP